MSTTFCHMYTSKVTYYITIDPVNQSSLDAIESAQGVFCLDKASASDTDSSQAHPRSIYWDSYKTWLANRFLHGNGTGKNSCNRWFDHAMQVCTVDIHTLTQSLTHTLSQSLTHTLSRTPHSHVHHTQAIDMHFIVGVMIYIYICS